jgi:putative NADH-flavin reductase
MPEVNNIRSLDTDVRVTVLETQVTSITHTMEKLEQKIDENYATLHHRISDMRDDLHKNIETKHDRVMEKLEEQNKASTEQHKAIAEKIQAIEKWRWMIMGGALVVGYVLAHLKLEKLF